MTTLTTPATPAELTVRELPFVEWHRLAATELTHLAAMPADPLSIKVLVVERDGAIIACWARIWLAHVEGLWVEPSLRLHAAHVVRALFAKMYETLVEEQIPEVLTGSLSSEMDRMLTTFGGTRVPGSVWLFPVTALEKF